MAGLWRQVSLIYHSLPLPVSGGRVLLWDLLLRFTEQSCCQGCNGSLAATELLQACTALQRQQFTLGLSRGFQLEATQQTKKQLQLLHWGLPTLALPQFTSPCQLPAALVRICMSQAWLRVLKRKKLALHSGCVLKRKMEISCRQKNSGRQL